MPYTRVAFDARSMRRGLFFIQLPPPIHGVSVMNARVVGDPMIRSRITIDLLKADYISRLEDIEKISFAKAIHWLALICRFGWLLVSRRIDFVYFTPVPTGIGFLRDMPFILLGKALCSRVIVHIHGQGIAARVSRSRVWRLLYRWVFGGCAIISASPRMQRTEFESLQLRGSRLYVVPNAVERVDVDRYRAPRQRDDPPRILFLSSTFPFKGVFDLLRALEQLVSEQVPFNVEIVGSSSPEWDDQVSHQIERGDLKTCATFRGALFGNDKYAALARADVFVHPTQNDYFPLVLLEAMQFGLPIVATSVGAIPEIVACAGIVVPPRDAPALCDALRSMLLDGARRAECGASARRLYLEHYAPERFSADLLGAFAAEGLA